MFDILFSCQAGEGFCRRYSVALDSLYRKVDGESTQMMHTYMVLNPNFCFISFSFNRFVSYDFSMQFPATVNYIYYLFTSILRIIFFKLL